MEEEGVITFDSLYEALRLEKYKTELQKLDKNFYKKSVKYLEEKKAILKSQESKDSVFANESIIKTKRQLENTRMIIKELYEKREAKIINMALFNSRSAGSVQDTESLLEEEKDMYNKLVRFTEAVPKFVGNDLNIYGPYEAEDVANLPGKVAEILVKNRRAEGI